MNWYPIETAPKDGTQVLLYGTFQWEDYDDIEGMPLLGTVVGFWGRTNWVTHRQESWQAVSANPYMDLCQPTHWMPLPEPPNG